MSKRENAATLYLYVKDYIMKLLISGDYPADTKLPTEYQLMEKLNVGRATVRSALAQLEEEGTIYKKQGVGTFVSKREKNFGLEPFISFSFIVKKLGLIDENQVLSNTKVLSKDEGLTEFWAGEIEVNKIVRLRSIEKNPLAMESNYFIKEIYDKLDKNKLDGALAHNMLATADGNITKIDTRTIVRAATADEVEMLKIDSDENIVETVHKVYMENFDIPVYYDRFIVPTHVLEFPFLG